MLLKKDVFLNLQFVLLPVDDDRRDLLVHEDEDGTEQRGDEGDDGGPPGVGPHWVYDPATIIPGWLQMVKDKTRREKAVDIFQWRGKGVSFYFQLFNQTYFEFVWNL